MNNQKHNYGIALMSLVLTIIIMIILAGSVILLLVNNNIINKASTGEEAANVSTIKELVTSLYSEEYSLNYTNSDSQIMSVVCEKLNNQGYLTYLDTSMNEAKSLYINKYEVPLVVSNADSGKKSEKLFALLVPDPNETNLNYIITINHKMHRMTCLNGVITISDTPIDKLELKTYKIVCTPLTPIKNNLVNLKVNDAAVTTTYNTNISTSFNLEISSTKSKIDDLTKAITVTLKSPDSKKVLDTKDIKVEVKKPGIEDYSWEEINSLAKEIAIDPNIDSSTPSVVKKINGKKYNVDVGDTKKITIDNVKYKVRVLGFKHDTLTNSYSYDDNIETTKAGISFEFVTSLLSAPIYQKARYSANWKDSTIRETLNSDTIESLTEFKSYIKSVEKKYILKHSNENSVNIVSDKLWLLSCSEIWTDNGWAITAEGNQYKFYSDISSSSTESSLLQKQNSEGKDISFWALRSPSSKSAYGDYFCIVDQNTCTHRYIPNFTPIAPCFAI